MRRSRHVNLNLPIASILRNPAQEWMKLTRGIVRTAADRKIAVDWNDYTPDQYVFAHVSIVCSVNVTNNGYYIEAPCDELVNTNGNAWTTQILMSTFKSFVGKNVYSEHVQVPSLSKGTILDAVLRPVVHTGKDGSTAEIMWCDILTATNRKHVDIVSRIESGELNAMSMGCLAHWITCSQCGKQVDDSMKNCDHIDNNLLNYFVDEKGKRRICAELCGRMIKNKSGEWEGDPKSVEFIEASWVEKPAFKGAVINHMIGEFDKKIASALDVSPMALQAVMDDLFHLRVADAEGMATIRVACKELRKRMRNDTVLRVADKFSI